VPATIEHMCCGAHTLQLSIKDGITNSRAGGILAKVRDVAKEARTPKLNEIMKKRAKKVAILDVETRWGSSFMMLDRTVELRPIIDEYADCGRNNELKLSEYQWKEASQLRDLLRKGFEVTKKLQYSTCTPGYFYRKWTGLLAYYENQGSLLAEEIAKSMKKRSEDLLDNGVLLAAVVLDVQNRDLLSEDALRKGEDIVVNLVLRLQGLSKEDEQPRDSSASSCGTDTNSESDEDIREPLKEKKKSLNSNAAVLTDTDELLEGETEVAVSKRQVSIK